MTYYATSHATARAYERFIAAGIGSSDAEDIIATAESFAAKCSPFEDVALRLRSLSAFIGHAWGDASNGDTIVAIIRGRMVQTYMLRRRSQPFTREALNVNRCVNL